MSVKGNGSAVKKGQISAKKRSKNITEFETEEFLMMMRKFSGIIESKVHHAKMIEKKVLHGQNWPVHTTPMV